MFIKLFDFNYIYDFDKIVINYISHIITIIHCKYLSNISYDLSLFIYAFTPIKLIYISFNIKLSYNIDNSF